jgi:hypothetical protein
LPRCGIATFRCLSSTLRQLFKERRRWFLRRMLGPSLETGTVFDIALSGNSHTIANRVSVMAAQEKCDDKGLKAAFGHRSLRCRQLCRALSRKAREEAHPRLRLCISLLEQLRNIFDLRPTTPHLVSVISAFGHITGPLVGGTNVNESKTEASKRR